MLIRKYIRVHLTHRSLQFVGLLGQRETKRTIETEKNTQTKSREIKLRTRKVINQQRYSPVSAPIFNSDTFETQYYNYFLRLLQKVLTSQRKIVPLQYHAVEEQILLSIFGQKAQGQVTQENNKLKAKALKNIIRRTSMAQYMRMSICTFEQTQAYTLVSKHGTFYANIYLLTSNYFVTEIPWNKKCGISLQRVNSGNVYYSI